MKHIFPIIVFVIVSLNAYCQIGGEYTYQFLNMPSTARLASVGGKNVSLNDNNLNLVIQNPALLSSEMNNNVSVSFNNHFAGIGSGYAAFAHTFEKGNISGGIEYIDYGTFKGADIYGNIEENFYAKDYVINVSYSYPIDSTFSIGATVKAIGSFYEKYSSLGFAVDIGAIYTSMDRLFSAGLVIRNLGSQVKMYSNKYELIPLEILAGVTKKLAHAPFRISLTLQNLQHYKMTYKQSEEINPSAANNEKSVFEDITDNVLRHIIGSVDFVPSKSFYLTFSYNHQRRKEMALIDAPCTVGFSFGGGINTRKFSLGYGYSVYHAYGGTHHFTVIINFSEAFQKE